MTTREIIIKVKKRVNKDDTNDFDNLSLFSIIEAYNKAQLNVVNYLSGLNNIYKSGIESTTKRIDNLSTLLNPTPLELTVTKADKYYISQSFPQNYMRYVSSYSLAKNNKCDSKRILHFPYEEGNIELINRNDNQNASFEWGEAPITIANNQLKIHSNNQFDVLNTYLTYLKYPINIDIQGYIKQDGTPSTTIDPELPDDVVEMCIDETVRIIQGDIQNPLGIQVAMQNIQRNE